MPLAKLVSNIVVLCLSLILMSSSGSSNSIAVTGAQECGSKSERLEGLCIKIHRCLGTPLTRALSVAEHGSATRAMLKARDMLLQGGFEITPTSRTCLLCTGISCTKRVNAEVETSETQELLKTTTTLVFSLLVLCEDNSELMCDEFEEVTEEMKISKQRPKRIQRDDENVIRAWKSTSLAQTTFSEECGTSFDMNCDIQDTSVSRAALREAKYCKTFAAISNLKELAAIFFKCSSAAMMRSVMSNAAPVAEDTLSFLTLDTVGMLNDANNLQKEKLSALVSAAESEAGQAVLRDMILSFKLPYNVVGVRRTLLLPREANLEATKNYTEILNLAHEAAMRGAEYSWESDPDQIHKVAAVLSGIAIILAETPEKVRKGDAFAGRITVPFIEARPPSEHSTRLGLVPSTKTWCVYKVQTNGTPTVQASKGGFDGFCEMALLFSRSLRV